MVISEQRYYADEAECDPFDQYYRDKLQQHIVWRVALLGLTMRAINMRKEQDKGVTKHGTEK